MTYKWDHQNRLLKMVSPNGTVKYEYDHLSHLVRRNNDIYVHDGYQIVLMINDTGVVKNRYQRGVTPDELLPDETSGNVLADHLGSVRGVLRLSGTTMTVAHGKLLEGFSGIVILQRSVDGMIKENTFETAFFTRTMGTLHSSVSKSETMVD